MFFNATNLPCLNVALSCLDVSMFFNVFKWIEIPLIFFFGSDIK